MTMYLMREVLRLGGLEASDRVTSVILSAPYYYCGFQSLYLDARVLTTVNLKVKPCHILRRNQEVN